MLKDIVSEIRSLEPFPRVASAVLQLSSREDIVPSELIEVIQTDAAITAKVLKLCNSAYYGFQREIASLHEAGNLLGTSVLVNLVLTSTANRYFRNYGNAGEDGDLQERLWKNSVANALASRLIAQFRGDVDKERAYTAGLLQNIGHLVLERFVEQERERVLAAVESGQTLLHAEHSVLGMHHAEIGARLLTNWGLPEVLVDTVRYHHTPKRASVDPVLTGTVHLAETLTWAAGLDDGPTGLCYDVSKSALELIGLNAKNFEGLGSLLNDELERAQDFVAA